MIKFKSIIIWLCKNFNWKERDEAAIYKCGNKNCPYRIGELNKLYPAGFSLTHWQVEKFFKDFGKPPNRQLSLF